MRKTHSGRPPDWLSAARTRKVRSAYCILFSVVLTILSVSASTLAQSGVECGCPKTGPYEDPAPGEEPFVTIDGKSPNQVYQVTATPGGANGMATLTVKRISDGKTVLTGVEGTNWGFSPDDDRFVYHYITNGVHNVVLYDLGQSPAKKVKELDVGTGSSTVQFSPSGRYFFYAYVSTGTLTNLLIVDAVTGVTHHQNSFPTGSGTGQDDIDMAGWGFGPGERSFVYAHATGGTSALWNLVNLETKIMVRSEPLPDISAYWQFSPCGDVIGLVQQPDPAHVSVRLFRTADGSPIPSQNQIFNLAPVDLRTTTASHIANVGGTDYVISSNTAGNACPGNPPANEPPTAAFTPPTNPMAQTSLQFTDASSDQDGTIVSRLWSFGDGGTSTQQNPTHTYSSAGTFSVSLKVTDDKGATDAVTKQLIVAPANGAPVAQDLTVTTDEEVAVPVHLSATDPEGGSLTYSVVNVPDHGSLTGTFPDLAYEPDKDYVGPDSFTYKAHDGTQYSNLATVTIDVNEVNDPPTISDVRDQFTEEELPTELADFSARDVETSAGNLVVTGESDNQQLVPDSNILIEGSGEGRTVEITPAIGQKSGTAQITLTVTDAGGATASDTFVLKVTPQNDPPVSVDPAFDDDDKVVTDFGSTDEAVQGLLEQPDGKMLAVGWTGDYPDSDFALLRYNADGSLDTSFGNGGGRTTDFNAGDDRASALGLQPDGKIVVAGSTTEISEKIYLGKLALARYNPDGSLDRTFDRNGKVTIQVPFMQHAWIQELAIQPDGKIVIVGGESHPDGEEMIMARFNPDGSLDSSFSGDGRLYAFPGSHSVANDVALLPDGRIMMAGYSGRGMDGGHFALLRYDAAGSLDPGFGTDGLLTTSFAGPGEATEDAPFGLVLQPDGKALVAGQALFETILEDGAYRASARFALARYNPDGSLDTSFGTDGKITTDFFSDPGRSDEVDAAYDLALLPDGRIVAAGDSNAAEGSNFALARYSPDGSLDTGFGTDGKITTDFPSEPGDASHDHAYALIPRPDGSLVAAGQTWANVSGGNFALARYTSDSSDTTPPAVDVPTHSFVRYSTLKTTGTPDSVPVDIFWAATDSEGAVTGYEVERSIDGGVYQDVALSGATSETLTHFLSPAHSYRYRVRATDDSGNASAWQPGQPFTVAAHQETSGAITYTGAWTKQGASSAYGGALKYATAKGATARFTFTGSSVAWVAPKSSIRGKANVYLDGAKVTTVDLRSATTQPRKVVFAMDGLDASISHKLEVRVLGTSGRPRVDVDAFVVLR